MLAQSDITPDEARAALNRWQRDPAFFVETVLGSKLWRAQREILESVRDNPRTAVRSAHATGKSFVAGRLVPWFLLTHPDSIVVTTAPTATQVRAILWQEIRRAVQRARVPLAKQEPLLMEWKLDDGWFAIGRTTKEPDAFQGFHAPSGWLLVVIDEGSGVPQPIWDAIDGVLTSTNSRLLALGNPLEASGPFFNEFKSSAVNKITVSAFDTPNFTAFGITQDDITSGKWEDKITGPMPAPWLVTPAWVADKHARWGDSHRLYAAKVRGDFPDESSENAVIPLSWIESAKSRDVQELPAGDPIEIGVDVARFGPDSTVIVVRRGGRATIHQTTKKEDTMETCGRVVIAMAETNATAIKVDDIGLGGGVTDRLRELKKPVTGINVAESATDKEHYANLRSELAWGLRERFRDGDIAIEPDDELEEELAAMRYNVNSRGQIIVEPKDELKKRIGRSPDKADALILAFAPERKRKTYTVGVLGVGKESMRMGAS